MLKSCSYCGGIHDNKYVCPKKPKKVKNGTQADKFRSTRAWTNKSLEIRQNSKYICQICLRELYNTISKYNYDTIEVHHIVPLIEDYDKRLDNNNLISVCRMHHEMCEDGTIPREVLFKIASEVKEKNIY